MVAPFLNYEKTQNIWLRKNTEISHGTTRMNTDSILGVPSHAPASRSRIHCFVITPHATLGPPLTPDFGSPVMPWSGFP